MGEVKKITAFDDTGVRKNVTDILDLLRKDELEAVCILYRTKDEKLRVFFNGDDLLIMGMASQLMIDCGNRNVLLEEHSYERQLGVDDDEEE